MPLVSSPIPNLIGGMSQQPASMRLPNMCDRMENAWPSVVSGLQKRPPTRHVANLSQLFDKGTAGHIIDRDDGYRYLVLVKNGSISVINLLTGAIEPVSYPVGTSYLSTGGQQAVDTFRFATLGDYTFIVNRTVVTQAGAISESAGPVPGQTRIDPTSQCTFYVTQAAYNTYYSCYINGNLQAAYLTPAGNGTGTTTNSYTGEVLNASDPCPDTSTIARKLRDQLNSHGFGTYLDGSSVTVNNFNPAWTASSQGGNGDKMLRVFITDVQSFSDLPPTMFDGRIVRVAADMTTQDDDYYVVYKQGVWIETLGWGQGEGLNLASMPHALIRNANGTWTFTTHAWEGRQVGDSSSSKTPSFVGFPINDIFTFTNRLGILADENVILSEAGNYENFYRTTCAQLLDSDPIDIAALHNNVDVLYHAVPYNRDFLLMSEKDQFRLTYQNYVGQKTTRIEYTASFNVSTRVPPRNVANSVYFVDDRNDYQWAKIYEFHPSDNATTDDADEITAPIPEVIPNNVDFFAATNRCQCAVAHSQTNPTWLYVNKFYWTNEQKALNSWGVWKFADCTDIHWADFSGNFLYMIVERNGSTFLEKVRVDEQVWDTDEDFEVMLDRRVEIAGPFTYHPIGDYSILTLPYPTSVTPDVILRDVAHGITGLRPATKLLSPTTVQVEGDLTGYSITVGIPYTMAYEFSTIYMRQRQAYTGTYQIIQDGRLQLRYLTLEYHDTSYFTVTVTLPGRAPFVTTFSGQVLGSDNVLGRQPVSTGKLRIPIMSENYKASIVVTNDTPFPCAFGSSEWQGIYHPKSVTRVQ
ncbi:hypothetical protein [Bradyrhizobium sp. SZCCHNRI2049]|uniref:phage nozzle protein n=1 Tax=Bradyrhizobium sp. SZCCHNRI2049 TaxID=3057287 RepID=UPI002916272C|nr:hypothetical protein [Bradyrhizobium sp. SZCCHNRI2049]